MPQKQPRQEQLRERLSVSSYCNSRNKKRQRDRLTTATLSTRRFLLLFLLLVCRYRHISAAFQQQISAKTTQYKNENRNLFLPLVEAADSATTTASSLRSSRHCRNSASSALFVTSGDENDTNELVEEGRTPLTGWNHNPPSDQSSFWKSTTDETETSNPPKQTLESQSSSSLRTGWLHNTDSPTTTQKTASPVSSNKAKARLLQAMRQQERNHRILSPPALHACKDRQIAVTEHCLSVPLIHDPSTTQQSQRRIDVYFSIVEEVTDENQAWFTAAMSTTLSPQQRAASYIRQAAMKTASNLMLYLQGGPGFGAPTPVVGLGFDSPESSWAAAALSTKPYQRIVLMDQRGTGKSTPLTKQSLEEHLFPDLFSLDEKEAGKKNDVFDQAVQDATEYLTHFRADSIVQDAEFIKEALMLPSEEPAEETEAKPNPWGCALGQSFGGFCMMSYLSFVEHPPKICLLTGGIAPMLTAAFDAYSSLWKRVEERSLLYYDMYPGDVLVVKNIVKTLLEKPAKLPSGGTLTARRFLQLGMSLGGGPSSFASMHALFNSAVLPSYLSSERRTTTTSTAAFSRAFLKAVDSEQPFDNNPIYFWLHESIYADGPDKSSTDWAAHRSYENMVASNPQFDYRLTSQDSSSDDHPVLFFGEMVFPWMAEDYAECGGVGCTAMAEALASKKDWGPLYNAEHMRRVLQDGRSKAAAAVYHGDLYVDFDCSMKVTARGGPLEKCKVYVTNEYQHSGLRDAGADIFTKLHGMAKGSIRTPS